MPNYGKDVSIASKSSCQRFSFLGDAVIVCLLILHEIGECLEFIRQEGGMSTDRREMLDIVCRMAIAAGEAILKVYAEEFDVRHKSDKTPVTEADLAAERIIVDRLMSAFPDIPCVAEELCESEGMPPCCDRFWAIDPLDGTREFIARSGEFAVLIALVEEGRPVLGVVHGPAVGLTYSACGPGTATRRHTRGVTSARVTLKW